MDVQVHSATEARMRGTRNPEPGTRNPEKSATAASRCEIEIQPLAHE
jgi:hypothetical protein